MTDMPFTTLSLSQSMLETLESLGYRAMTPVQEQALPAILAGQDVIAQASTGTGKTAAFAIGLLRGIDAAQRTCQALVLCPTRELADQVAREVRRLARNENGLRVVILSGGLPMGPQTAALENGAHVIVGTPGRVLKHLSKDSLQLSALKVLVLDEADRMLDMGFFDSIADIVRQAPVTRQTLLFSATYPASIGALAARVMREPQRVDVAQLDDNSLIEQRFYEIADSERADTLLKLLACYRPQTCLVFCVTRQQCQTLADALCRQGIAAAALHGDMEQKDRDQTLVQFANGSACILVATDVAARGLDISSVDAVFNYQLAHDADTHTHRIGRTGRAGQSGMALSLFTASDAGKLI
ncbi:MAG: ATP-dependent RNA helicase DbpA, partial [Gammaproteobacteria bacterium HGW-Gammaproteobacteria-14]